MGCPRPESRQSLWIPDLNAAGADRRTGPGRRPADVFARRQRARSGGKPAVPQRGVPVARGAGTGLSGGTPPHAQGVLPSLAKFRSILDVEPGNRTARVQPGVRNLAISQAAACYGLNYAPDPSSQIACTIGGNVAENSGGVHCLKYGLTITTSSAWRRSPPTASASPSAPTHRMPRDTACGAYHRFPPRQRWMEAAPVAAGAALPRTRQTFIVPRPRVAAASSASAVDQGTGGTGTTISAGARVGRLRTSRRYSGHQCRCGEGVGPLGHNRNACGAGRLLRGAELSLRHPR